MDLGRITTGSSFPSPKSKKLFQKTSRLISNGCQTLSKHPSKFVQGVYPIYLEHGNGAYVWDIDGNKFIDYPLGLGAILLGHANWEVTHAMHLQAYKGTIFTLPSYLETELAEKLVKIIPCAEKVRYLKTGSDATSAAVRISRSYTKKDHIAYCGYHGWHDWFTSATIKNSGIPTSTNELIHKFEYNNISSLLKLFEQYDIGTVILEPYIYDEPKDNFLNNVISLAHKNKALVIFDEVVTGFRTLGYSAQKMFNAIPDLACFGKAMANGMPISVVCGRAKYMNELEGDCFVSSTFGGELLSIVASLATINVLETEHGVDRIWEVGKVLKDGYNKIAKELNIDSQCIGYPCRTMFMFPSGEHKSLFWQECIKRGVLFGYAQFITPQHGGDVVNYTLSVIGDALEVVKDNWDKPLKALKGKPAGEVFRLVVTKQGM